MPELDESKNLFRISRIKGPSPAGSTTYIGLRGIDPLLHYALLMPGSSLSSNIVTTFGGHVFSQGPISNTGFTLLDKLELSPYRLIILGMSAGSAVKQVLWQAFVSEQEMQVSTATMVCVVSTIFNATNTLMFLGAHTSAAYGRGQGPYWFGWPGARLTVGSCLFVVGILTELISEIQRKAFRNDPKNNGKPYTRGLFGAARHINYAGYNTWRTGFAIAASGWTWGACTFAFFFYDFISRGVPLLDAYCEQEVN